MAFPPPTDSPVASGDDGIQYAILWWFAVLQPDVEVAVIAGSLSYWEGVVQTKGGLAAGLLTFLEEPGVVATQAQRAALLAAAPKPAAP